MSSNELHDLMREALTPDQLYDVAEALDVTVGALTTGEREVSEDFDEENPASMAARSWDDE